jgi:glycosyltransferase involved in cell wall biosynthesis
VRILVVTHAPLRPEFGAAQMALHLAAALRDRGHDALAWSPEPLPAEARWWNVWRWQQRRIEGFLAANRFDVVDLPAISISRRVAALAAPVARSVQPELRYFGCTLAAQLRRLPRSGPRLLAEAPVTLRQSAAVLAGWRRARVLLCLGRHERDWMAARFPRLREKLLFYLDAPGAEEQEVFADLRARRRPGVAAGAGAGVGSARGVRFLWIGRWTAHKGPRRLLRFAALRLAARPADSITVAGCGPGAARDCPADLLAGGQLRLVPSFDRADLPGLLAAHDGGLFTSVVEGWGLALNEMLEAGLTVFATPAGGVADLRPFFPASLRPFPPPLDFVPGPPPEDLAANGYYREYSWAGIAARYEAEVLPRVAPQPRGRRAA